jgi:hypothetical protein
LAAFSELFQEKTKKRQLAPRSPSQGLFDREAAAASLYFQSFKISSSAISRAAFRLFCMMLRICASSADCFFFFFLSLSFWF